MPPPPFFGFFGGVVSVLRLLRFFGRFVVFFGRRSSSVVVVGSVVGRRSCSAVVSVVVGRFRRWRSSSLPPSSPAITITAITRPTITAIRQATSRRMLPCGRCRPSGDRGRRSSSSGSGPRALSLVLRSEDRVEDRVGVLDLEAVSQARARSPPGCCRRPPSGSPAGGRRRGSAHRRRWLGAAQAPRRARSTAATALQVRAARARRGCRPASRLELGPGSASAVEQALGLLRGSPPPGRRSASVSVGERGEPLGDEPVGLLAASASALRLALRRRRSPARRPARPRRRSPPGARRCSPRSELRRRCGRLAVSRVGQA